MKKWSDYVGHALGIIGILLAVYFYLAGQKDRQPVYFSWFSLAQPGRDSPPTYWSRG